DRARHQPAAHAGGSALVAVHAALDADVFHRARKSAAVLHRAVLDARLRRIHAGRRDPAVAARDLEWGDLPKIPPRALERRAAHLLRQLRAALELVRSGQMKPGRSLPLPGGERSILAEGEDRVRGSRSRMSDEGPNPLTPSLSPPGRGSRTPLDPSEMRLPSRAGEGAAVALIIPVLNEAQTIAEVVRAVPRDGVREIIVVEGGSREETGARAGAGGARRIVEPRSGYGAACLAGVLATGQPVVAFLDGDGSDDPAEIARLVEPILAGTQDFV